MKYLKDGWLILALALIFGSGLAAVQSALDPIIAKNQKDKTYNRIPLLTLGADAIEGLTVKSMAPKVELLDGEKTVETLRVEETAEDSPVTAYRVYRGDDLLGYVLEGSGSGYADRITTLVGLSADLSKITGVSVIKQMETPNLGDKITGSWVDQYAGKSLEPPLEVVKNNSGAPDNNRIDGISGATISSRCLTTIVNDTAAQFIADLPSLSWTSGQDEAAPEVASPDLSPTSTVTPTETPNEEEK